MSTASPPSLLYLSVDNVAKNYRQLCDARELGTGIWIAFKNNYCLPANVCELLLQQFSLHYDYRSRPDFFTLFTNPERCPLRRFCLRDLCMLEGCYGDYKHINWQTILKMILEKQNLVEVDLGPLVHTLFACNISPTNWGAVLKSFSVENYKFDNVMDPWVMSSPNPPRSVSFIKNFTNLKHLNLHKCLNIMDEDIATLFCELRHLESIDLSQTGVLVIDVCDELAARLKVLFLYDTPLVYSDHITELLKLSNLRHLDISRQLQLEDNFDSSQINKFLSSEKSLPWLISLDISGAGKLDNDIFGSFLENHRKLSFLGLLDTNQNYISKESSDTMLGNMEVTGDRSLREVLACLKHYKNRPEYLTIALKTLFTYSYEDNLTTEVELRKTIVQTVLNIIRRYMNSSQVDLETAASACLYNYVRHDTLKQALHISILSDMVHILIQLLRNFPQVKQIQKNCIIVLYNKYVLGAAKFSAFQLSELLFKATLLIREENVTGIALDIIAYLSSKISVEETLVLGTRQNVEKLLSIIGTQVDRATVDALLLCALRVLWNLTDEAPRTCHLLVDNRGLPLAYRALQTFDNRSEVLTKLLGVMNNLAEVAAIRPVLMCDEFVSLLRKYLDKNYAIDVSYFAAGTLCNLLLDWPEELQLFSGTQSSHLNAVVSFYFSQCACIVMEGDMTNNIFWMFVDLQFPEMPGLLQGKMKQTPVIMLS